MDLLQIALIFLIFLLSVLLSVLGVQVFFILKDLKKSLDKLEVVLDDTRHITSNLQKPAQAAADVTEAVESGVEVVKAIGAIGSKIVGKKIKPVKRLFKTH